MQSANPIVLYDGVCGLCNRLVQFILKRDTKKQFRFASLQSDFAATVLTRHGFDPEDLDTVHVVLNYDRPDERVLDRSEAVLRVWHELGGAWSALAASARIIPHPVRELFYRFVAHNRYRVFGKYESCMLPDPSQRGRFLDL
jgi:predicted DCC family thiol-disulfide oxidoreductase YuxK